MANLDRPGIVALLDRLGEQDDAAVLEAARALHRTVNEAGATWDDLLRRDFDDGDADEGTFDEPAADEAGGLSDADKADARRLIERLLGRGSLSDTLREDLSDLKSGLADGSFDAMDLRYVRALARRLNA
ncbi:MAG: hypothetical protein ACRECO_20760 [Xanthobacteraceae bacterium]